MARLRLSLLTVLVACGSSEPPVGDIEFRVAHYDYTFDLETRAARATVHAEVTTGGDCLHLPLRVEEFAEVGFFEAPALRAELNNQTLTACGEGWESGSEIELTANVVVPLETWQNLQVGYSVSTDLEGAPFSYLVSWVGGCDRFGPCDPATDQFATYTFRVTHPSDTQVLCPGVITAGDTETVCDFDYPGGPTYSTFGIAASPSWVATDLGSWDGVAVTLYDTPSGGIADAFDTEVHRDFLRFMTENFGPYPYGDELRFATGPTAWGGFEHPGNVLLYNRLDDVNSAYSEPLTHTTNHEIAHMWAGDQTTLATVYDFVWKEAMAEYLTFVFDDGRAPAVAQATAAAWKLFSVGAAYHPVPMDGPEVIDFYSDVYGPGPMILFRQLEVMYSRDAVMAALRSLLGSERSLSVDDIRLALERETGAELTNYFDAWVYGSGAPQWPRFDVTLNPVGDGEYDLVLSQENAAEQTYGCAFTVRLLGSAPEDILDVAVNLGPDGKATETIRVTPGFEVTNQVFDVFNDTLARESVDTAALVAPHRQNPWLSPQPPVPYLAQ